MASRFQGYAKQNLNAKSNDGKQSSIAVFTHARSSDSALQRAPLQSNDANAQLARWNPNTAVLTTPKSKSRQSIISASTGKENRGEEKEWYEDGLDMVFADSHFDALDRVLHGDDANRAGSAPNISLSIDGVENRFPVQLPHANTFPCTPGAKLSLKDLIGDLDETTRRPEAPVAAPQEQIGWMPPSTCSLITPNRKYKRARSSSPSCPTTSSQRQRDPAFRELNLLGKTVPETDLTADLWNTYAAGQDAVEYHQLPDLRELLHQASPRPVETPAKSSGLRRWASAGNAWPAEANKRRKLELEPIIEAWRPVRDGKDLANNNKVADMIEKLQQSLVTQRSSETISASHLGEMPSSSSPLPGAATTLLSQINRPESPRGGTGTTSATDTLLPPPRMGLLTRGGQVDSPADRNPDTLQMRQATSHLTSDVVAPAVLHLQCKAPLPAFKRPTLKRVPSASGRQYPMPQPSASDPFVQIATEIDEFDDNDFDLTAEDFEVLTKPSSLGPIAEGEPLARETNFRQIEASPVHIQQKDSRRMSGSDEFGDDDLDEDVLAQAEMSATQQYTMPKILSDPFRIVPDARVKSIGNHRSHEHDDCWRYIVRRIVPNEYLDRKGHRCPEVVLLTDDEQTRLPTALTLRDSWIETQVEVGSVVHVTLPPAWREMALLEKSPTGQVLLSDDDKSPLLILHPDHLLSATTVADSFDCMRKAVLQDRIKAASDNKKPLVYGKILHEIFQQALLTNQWTSQSLCKLVHTTVQSHVEGLWELGMRNVADAVNEIQAKLREVVAWASVFVGPHPTTSSSIEGRNGDHTRISLSKLIAIEEHVWSPRFGLKGNIDATVQLSTCDETGGRVKNIISPFEVKTGRTTKATGHQAQTALYTLLLSDRYRVNTQSGILYYMESSTMTQVAPPTHEIRQMIQQRNRLAAHLHAARHPDRGVEDHASGKAGIPPMLKDTFKCGKCYAQGSCFTYHALAEQGSVKSAGMIDDTKKNHSLTWQEAVGHILDGPKLKVEQARQWFTKWDRLLTFEEGDYTRLKKELWTMSSTEREKAGRCFGELTILDDLTMSTKVDAPELIDGIESSSGRINRFSYVFGRASTSTSTRSSSFGEGSQLVPGEAITISSENGQWGLANGYIVSVSRRTITVAVDRKLGDARRRLHGFDERINQAFLGVSDLSKGDFEGFADEGPTLYRLDKDEFSNGLSLVRRNLVTLMSPHPVHQRLREIVVQGATPGFSAISMTQTLPPSQLGPMNEDQVGAVEKAMSAQDCALILGMPGTGKTTTIAYMIRALLAEKKSILLTSYTHTAVDNILLKIRSIVPERSVLRLGVPSKINGQVQEFCQLVSTQRSSIDEVEDAYMGCQIVATTCMGTNHAVFNHRMFDVCIIDEASQITLPTSLGPLLHARKFILVGDHFQLPPLVQNRAALEGGLDISLFRQISEAHPEAVAVLGRQYRMCEEIMTLSNTLIYNGRLRCGDESVAQRSLTLAKPHDLSSYHSASSTACRSGKSCWLSILTRPETKVLFADTDALGEEASESLTSGKNITNQMEAILCIQTVLAFLALGVPLSAMGIITLYRSQLSLIRRLAKDAGISNEIEIDSADRFQGRDKECIVLSMVRSNSTGTVGDLLKDSRRVNVALTRARSKLIMFGSRKTLQHNDLLARLLCLVTERDWAWALPVGADKMHSNMWLPFSSASPSASCKTVGASPTKHRTPSGPRQERKPLTQRKDLQGTTKVPPKIISGRGFVKKGMRAMQEQIAAEMLENLFEDGD